MYFANDEVSALWRASENGGVPMPVLVKQPFSRPIVTEDALLAILQRWGDEVRAGRSQAPDIEYIDAGILPDARDATLDGCIRRIETTWTTDWFAYVNDVHQYDGEVWERALEILLPAIRAHRGLPAGGFRIEGFFGRYGSTPTGIHLDSSDNFSFIVRGPKRLLFWPRDRFQPLIRKPDRRAPAQELALTRQYAAHVDDAIVIEANAGDVVYWPKEFWHVGSSPEGWTAMVNLAMWWNASPITLARFVLDRVVSLEGEPRPHPFDPDRVTVDALTPPSTLREPVRDAMSQVAARSESAARVIWASVATSYGFTTPPARLGVPPLADSMRVRVKHPIVALNVGAGCVVMACGHQMPAMALENVDEGCARLNAAIGAEYAVRDIREVFGGANGDEDARARGARFVGELVSCRALEIVA